MVSESDTHYAGLWRRFLALTTDIIALSLFFFPVTRIVKGVWIMGRDNHLWGYGWLITDPLCLIFLGVIAIYFIILEGIFGATFGKWLLGLRVTKIGGGRPGLGRSAVRNLLRIVDALPALNILGVILILTSSEKARFGDRAAGTRVIIYR
ncbi:putative RDD domain containing protein [Candidatus Zixiibacteriota bacterium]|nr:putative RDD domain containing protein [candidate division Zixibacteria bacterium]